MKRLTMLSRLPMLRNAKLRSASIAPVALAILLISGAAAGVGLSIYEQFLDDSGYIQSAPSSVKITTAGTGVAIPVNTVLDQTNTFFNPTFGTNGQACVTCHQPAQGFTIHVDFINDTFDTYGLTDPLFRPVDTADNPHVDNGAATADDYSLFLNLGVVRIGKTFAATSDFNVTADDATNAKFAAPDVFPLISDPQQSFSAGGTTAHPTLSLFRRPLVNTNVHLDSSVLWDGRASIGNMRAQAIGAAKTLLLNPAPSNADADEVVAFMLGVYTDQVFDFAAGTDANGNCALPFPGNLSCGSGFTNGNGATGGVANLVSLATGPNAPCANFLESPCAANVPGYDLFNAWAGLPNLTSTNAGKASVVRGQDLFNNAVLHVPADLQAQLGTTIHCTTCHNARNIGNNVDPNFFARVGTDSLDIIGGLINDPSLVGSPTRDDLLTLFDRVASLPLYCMHPVNQTPTPDCSGPGEVSTTDPGRAMVTGKIADAGKFKPPVLRGLAARSPYFHAAAAENIQMLIHFYNARFHIGLTEAQVNDLGAFLEDQ